MLKKLSLLALAVGALVAFAIPATASASGTWTDKGVNVAVHTTVKATGTIQFVSKSGAGGIHCKTAHAEITIQKDGKTTTITKFECTEPTTFGSLKEVFGCSVEKIHTTMPWAATPTGSPANTIDITGIHINNTMNAPCLVGTSITVTNKGTTAVTATPNNIGAISSVAMGGEVETSVGPSVVSGTLAVEPAATYGIK
jgi:hypothetical protein